MKTRNGFTLIELMIVVAIIAILTSIAYPSYVENTRTNKRTTAQSDLLKLSNFLERRFTENNSYLILNGTSDPISSAACATVAGCTPALEPGIIHADYNYSFSSTPTATAFELQAVPQNAQASDKCGTMTYDQTGAKTATLTNCWR
ncbi:MULTISPECIES: type IV pilin protein [Cycloclasticus]|jgi:type IV pilus assembly protein PilE|uniref:type IV pilin protein n=1 Tax=Cycloclasticus TaxID=34067 RepID=UPI000919DBD9|nr:MULTISPECIES: type IV pilin protein [Cycloclasticus]MBV1897808.1 type IV pilin protein [Cycloclasticus sp.]MDF1830032.1 type IV pilin protein [Cycloclasticus pugetii]SHJ23136.1 type IV pilus assembly protein PilE [Cycloclasticus pugetii]|tara:strand:+ start:503 stop:940 length:438 start_codon:yes stop_codon:yes gene_type:complete